jgi:hypothetical protein
MRALRLCRILTVCALIAPWWPPIGPLANPLLAQEAVTNVDKPGTFNKYLTPSMVDRWVFNGKQGQLVMVRIQTKEFDATLQLVQVVDGAEQQLLEVDDDGSNANLAYRLPADGEYKLLVHGFEFKGGGNYSVSLQQVQTQATAVGEVATGSFDDQGMAWLHFSNSDESFVRVDLAGGGGERYEVLDSKGVPLPAWADLVRLQTSGDHYLRLDGARGRRFELRLHPVVRSLLPRDVATVEAMKPKSARVFDIPGTEASFGLLELEVTGDLFAQFVVPNRTKTATQTQALQSKRGPRMLEVPSKGKFRRYAMVWGEEETYQLQIATERGADVKLHFFDPRLRLAINEPINRTLAVGAVQFFTVHAEQGQALTLSCQSESFDSELRLYDKSGQMIMGDDDGGGGFDAKLRYMPFASSELILAVSSRGHGGSGAYTLQAQVEAPKRIGLDVKEAGTLAAGETGFYVVGAVAGQKLLFLLQSEHEQPVLKLLNTNGVELAQSTSQQSRDAVLIHEFTESGRFAIVLNQSAEGAFQLRVILAN